MFERELMILGLRRQRNLLENLIQRLEDVNGENGELLVRETAGQVARNLRRLRGIKDEYYSHFQKDQQEQQLIRMGLSPDADTGVSRTGLYTDFT